jgi:hypothetical protein
MSFRVLYPASLSIDASDFNEAFKNAVKLNTFLNVEQMIIADQLNNYRRANIGYTDIGDGRKRARIQSYPVSYPAIAPFLVLSTPAEKTADKPAEPSKGATTTPAKPEEKKDRVIFGPFGPMFSPANPIPGPGLTVVQPGSNQLLGVSPALPVGTDGKPVAGLVRPFGVGVAPFGSPVPFGVGVPLQRPGLVPMANYPVPMGRVF